MKDMISEAVYLHYLNALLDGDKKQCSQIVINLIGQKASLKEIYLDLFQRSMYRIGEMWDRDKCSVANEHVATRITEGLIELVVSIYASTERISKLALITCIDKEFHELGAKMVVGFLEARGWDTIFVGSNTPDHETIRLIKENRPDIVGISSSYYINIIRLMKLIEEIKERFPEQEILIGGHALAEGRSECLLKYKNVSYITCLNGLEKYLTAA